MNVQEVDDKDMCTQMIKSLLDGEDFIYQYTTTNDEDERVTKEWGMNVNIDKEDIHQHIKDDPMMQARLQELVE